MPEEKFWELVEEYQGFELVHGYRDFEDHYLGGKGSECWYVITKDDKVKEAFLGTLEDGAWKDIHIKGSGTRRKTEEMESGATIRKIAEKAYLAQEENWVTRRTPSVIEDSHPHRHYVYGFGDKALDVSAQYGVSITWSDLKDVAAGFILRDILTGEDVQPPEGI